MIILAIRSKENLVVLDTVADREAIIITVAEVAKEARAATMVEIQEVTVMEEANLAEVKRFPLTKLDFIIFKF